MLRIAHKELSLPLLRLTSKEITPLLEILKTNYISYER